MSETVDALALGRGLATQYGTRARALHTLERGRRMAEHAVFNIYARREELLVELDAGTKSLREMDGPPIIPWDARKEAWFRALGAQGVAPALEGARIERAGLRGEAECEIEGEWLAEVVAALQAMGDDLPPSDWDRRA